jgi:hypothetical protein
MQCSVSPPAARQPMNFWRTAVIPCLLLLLGCETTGEGTLFNVKATLSDSSCGSGAVDAKDNWDFQVRIKKDDTTFTWYDVDSAVSTQGTINDTAFSVSDSSTYAITNATGVSNGCSVRRHDSFSGDATLNKSKEIVSLEGDIVMKYSQATGYDCDSLIGATNGFDDLPCTVNYTFVATKD